MARVTTVQKSMKPGKCGRCGDELPKGSAYRWAKPGFRSRTRLIRCMKPECSFRGSELTTSLLSSVYAAQEDFQDRIDSWNSDGTDEEPEVLQEAADDAREGGAQEAYDAYDEANSAWEDSSGAENEQFTEPRDAIEEWQGELEDIDFPDRPEEPELEDPGPQGDDEDDHDYEARVTEFEQARQEYEDEVTAWVDECRDAAQAACDALSV